MFALSFSFSFNSTNFLYAESQKSHPRTFPLSLPFGGEIKEKCIPVAEGKKKSRLVAWTRGQSARNSKEKDERRKRIMSCDVSDPGFDRILFRGSKNFTEFFILIYDKVLLICLVELPRLSSDRRMRECATPLHFAERRNKNRLNPANFELFGKASASTEKMKKKEIAKSIYNDENQLSFQCCSLFFFFWRPRGM